MAQSMDNSEMASGTAEADRPGWLAATTGLNAAIAVSYLACKPPQSHTLPLTTRLWISAIYILIACLAGAAATWIVLARRRSKQFRSLVLWGTRGWIFLPAIMIFLRERSVWVAPALAILSAVLMAAYLRRLPGAMTDRSIEGTEAREKVEKSIFTTQVRVGPTSWIPFGVSLCLYGALMAAITRRFALVTLLLGAGAFLLVVYMLIVAQAKTTPDQGPKKRSHPYTLLATAFCCAFVALSVAASPSGVALRMRVFDLPQALASTRPTKRQPSGEHSSGGYQTIVLWPIRKKEKTLSSPYLGVDPSHLAKPWVIPFYGPYLYFKILGETPGSGAHITHGDPLKVNVRSTDRSPLLMEAHQNLSDPIDMACCREIQVVLKNDVSMGASEVGISLTDSHSKSKISQNLGIKSVALDGSPQHAGDSSSLEETVSFPLPEAVKIKRFNQIAVTLFPDPRHLTAGRKVAVERFIMIPK